MKKWQVLESKLVWERPWFSVRIDRVRTGRGAVLEDYPVVHTRDWACIVPVTHEGQVVLVRQYRHGVERETHEFPAGGVDAGESPLAAARRELREETGFEAEEWRHLRSVLPEPTRHRHSAHLYLALGARRVGEQRLEPGEDADLVLFPTKDFAALVAKLDHAVHVAAAYLARDSLGGRWGS